MDVEQARRELYVLPPEEFVGRRTELVKAARAAGDRPLATVIGGIRKPSRSASLLNRFAVAHPDRVQELLALAGSLRRAERELDSNTLRALTQRRRAIVGALAREAGAGASGGVAEEVTATLNAALADDTVATDLQQSTLAEAASWSGFGLGGPTLTVVPGGRSTPAKEPEAPATKSAQQRERMRAEAEQARAHAERTRTRTREESAQAVEAARQAEKIWHDTLSRVESLQVETDRLAVELERVSGDLEVAQSELRQAQTAYRAARLRAERATAGQDS